VGNFTHPPNVDAAQRLAGDIFPAIHAQRPDVRLWIVGDQPPPELVALAGEAVTVTGRVPDVRPYLEAAAVVVVPMRLGGGMRVKVMEALAAGKALIASRVAVEGLDLTPGAHYLLAETDEEFEIAILTLLIKPQQRLALGTAAYGWARGSLGWARAGAAYEQLYDQLLQGRKRGRFGRIVLSTPLEQTRSEGS
jgi:glycosyltransferase involved in cell wall biosynthesis